MENLKTKVKKIQFLSSRAFRNVTVILLILSLLVTWTYDQDQLLNLTMDLTRSMIKAFRFVAGI